MIKKIKHFSELVMFEHTIFSAAFSLMALIVAGFILWQQGVRVNWSRIFEVLGFSLLALVCARNFAMGFNRLCDYRIDAQNPRTLNRPSVDGRISILSMVAFCVCNAAIFVFASYFINTLAFELSLPFLLILGAYSLCKRFSFLAHFVLGICLALAPISGGIAVLGRVELWSIFLAIGVMFWVSGFDLLYSLQDMEFDRKMGLFSVPARFGERITLWVSRFSHLFAVVFWALFLYKIQSGFFGILGLLISCAMLCYEQYLVAKDFRNIPKAFFVTNGYLGFIFLIFILLDVIVRIYYAPIN